MAAYGWGERGLIGGVPVVIEPGKAVSAFSLLALVSGNDLAILGDSTREVLMV